MVVTVAIDHRSDAHRIAQDPFCSVAAAIDLWFDVFNDDAASTLVRLQTISLVPVGLSHICAVRIQAVMTGSHKAERRTRTDAVLQMPVAHTAFARAMMLAWHVSQTGEAQ
jgi:hypothetical protein